MKRVLSGLIIIFMGLFLTGCSKTYNAERLLWKANQKSNKIFQDPKVIPEGQYAEVLTAYEKIIKKYPERMQSGAARFKMGMLYVAKKDFETAEEMFRKTLEEHPDKNKLCAKAQVNIGKCYEERDDWEEAYIEYKKAFNDYTDTRVGLAIPFYIASYCQRKRPLSEAKREFDDALATYRKLIKDNPKTPLAYLSHGFIVRCYEGQKKWKETIDALWVLHNNYPKTPEGAKALVTIGIVYQKGLNRLEKAIEVYEQYIEKYPKTKMAVVLTKAIERLKAGETMEPPIDSSE